MDHRDDSVVQQKREIDEAIRLEEADGPWKWTEIFKNGPLKIRRRFLLVIGKLVNCTAFAPYFSFPAHSARVNQDCKLFNSCRVSTSW